MVHGPKKIDSFDGYVLIEGEEWTLPRKMQAWVWMFDNLGPDKVGPDDFEITKL